MTERDPGKGGGHSTPGHSTDVEGKIRALAGWPLDPVEQNRIFHVALANMSQGLCMFDADLRLVLCNDAYAELYGLRPEDIRPGTPLRNVLLRRLAKGTTPADADYVERRLRQAQIGTSDWFQVDLLRDGRYIGVTHRPLPTGGSIALHEDITERERAKEEIAYLAAHDSLTGLPNRASFRRRLEAAVAQVGPDTGTALMFLDLDDFKTVNDSLGHAAGDRLLEEAARRLSGALSGDEFAARLGGDEFALIRPCRGEPGEVAAFARRVIAAVSGVYGVDGHVLQLGLSCGVAIAPEHGTDPDLLLRRADRALYRAKSEGEGGFCVYDPEVDPCPFVEVGPGRHIAAAG